MSAIDFGRHNEDYASCRPGFPASFYDRLAQHVIFNGARCLDLATGPGTIALELAARGSSVTGVDISEALIETARRLARDRGCAEMTDFQVARAERTGLQEESFDLVAAGQAWHWFDGPAVFAEATRVLRPGGLLVIAYFSYLALHSQVAAETEALILKFNPSWGMAGWSGILPELVDDVIRGGFHLIEAFCYDHDELFSHEAWRGRMRTCNGVGSGGLSPEDVDRFDGELALLLKASFPDPIAVPHRVWSVIAKKPT